jgi:hypothetical protein
MAVVAIHNVSRPAAASTLGERHWRVVAIALLSVRVIQSFIECSLVVGVSGPIAAGKTRVSRYLEGRGFSYARESQSITVRSE